MRPRPSTVILASVPLLAGWASLPTREGFTLAGLATIAATIAVALARFGL